MRSVKSAYVLSLMKGDLSVANKYGLISKLQVLTKVLEMFVSVKLKEFLDTNNTLSQDLSGFRKQHNTITASIKSVNGQVIEALNCKNIVNLFLLICARLSRQLTMSP